MALCEKLLIDAYASNIALDQKNFKSAIKMEHSSTKSYIMFLYDANNSAIGASIKNSGSCEAD